MVHTHIITDHDDHFIIDPITRKIQPETPAKNMLIRGDHNCERYTFELPRYIEGHDVTQTDSVKIHYINISSDVSVRNADVYEVDDLGLLENNTETAAFTWLISNNATTYSGSLSFAIEFQCFSDETISYAWHTGIYSSISIGQGIDNDQTVIERYSDILEEWRQELFGITNGIPQAIESLETRVADIEPLKTSIAEITQMYIEAEISDTYIWGRTSGNESYLQKWPTETSGSVSKSTRIKVSPGEKYFVKADRGYYTGNMGYPLISCTYNANGDNAGDDSYYIIEKEYEPIVADGNEYMITIPDSPDGCNYLLINSCSDVLEVRKIIDIPEELNNRVRCNESIIDLTNTSYYDVNTYYPVTGTRIPKGGLHKIHVYSTFDDDCHPSWATNVAGYTCNMVIYDTAEDGGQTNGNAICTDYTSKYTNGKICGYVQMAQTSTPVVIVRGGGKYHVGTDYEAKWTIQTTAYTINGDTVRPGNKTTLQFNRATVFANLNGNVIGTLNGHSLGKSIPSGGTNGQVLCLDSNGNAVWKNAITPLVTRVYSAKISSGTMGAGDLETIDFSDIPDIQGYEPKVAIPQTYMLIQDIGAQLQLLSCEILYEETAILRVVVKNIGESLCGDASFNIVILYSAT